MDYRDATGQFGVGLVWATRPEREKVPALRLAGVPGLTPMGSWLP